MKMRVSKYESEGTCSQYYELTEEFWHTVFGKDWNKLPHKVLDFSSDAFVFSSLKASNGGILNSQLNLKHLKELNLHNNCLTEVENVFISTAPFSHSLRTLILSKNFLTSPTIDLPYLEHLDLSNNQLSTYPTLNYVPELKVFFTI
jgi:Leucine-rich repeat (LRR) protein